MFDYSNCRIGRVAVHRVGNKNNGDDIFISKSELNIDDAILQELLIKYFLSNITNPELYSFTSSNDDFKLNPVYSFAKEIFDHEQSFYIQSVNLAKHLYESSNHPNIKEGDFYIAYFTGIALEGEIVEAVGLFKSETKDTFLKLANSAEGFKMNYEDGIDIKKLDKGCLVLNTLEDEGYKVYIIDKANRGSEAQFWKEQFLNLKPLANDFHFTKNIMNLTKAFVADKLAEDFVVTKADQVDYLNRSMNYFKKKEQFDAQEFGKEVFADKNVIHSFLGFKDEYRNEKDVQIEEGFAISPEAVKKQQRVFKSVLKLDKNFHIYIHGDKQLIERGIESDGRKFYKIYYKEEN